jgi:selenide, water dikinase
LAQVLRHVPLVEDPRVLVSAATRDDAAVFRVAPDRAVVATVDFFTPIVDDPYDFGRIAAANALSDVYAMGATPLFALSIVGWPRGKADLSLDVLGEVLRGGSDVVKEAGAFVLGGHSVDDPEPKFGMVAIGEVHPDAIVTNAGAKVGDWLVLTKPIGTGILATALKRDRIASSDMAEAVKSMTTLNAGAARAMKQAGRAVHAATDVTGFGLLGHLKGLLQASGVAAEVDADAVPLLPRARELAAAGSVPGGTTRNLESVQGAVSWDGIADVDRILLADAQTSGGLLIAVSSDGARELVAALDAEGTPAAAVIGRITAGPAGTIRVRHAG